MLIFVKKHIIQNAEVIEQSKEARFYGPRCIINS